MAETLVSGRRGQVYAALESTFGTSPGHAATDAIRHLAVKLQRNAFNRADSPEKKWGPGRTTRFDREETADWSLEALLRPSGTLNTLAEASEILEAGFGSKSNTTLSTTVSASPTPTATGCTVASATGLAKHQAILVVVSGVKYLRFLTDVTGSALTWAPALPAAPATGAALKGVCTYRLSTDLALSLAIAHYLHSDTTHSRLATGAVVDRLAFDFARNDEARFSASGPCKTVTTPAASKPAAFTTVGGNPPSGLTGQCYIGAAAYKMLKLNAEITNGLRLRYTFGSATPIEILPRGRRLVTLGLDALVADESVIYDNAESGTTVPVMLQQGFTEGNIVGLYAPLVDFDIPSPDDGDDEPTWPFKGVCLESADQQNDEVILALA